MVEKKVVFDVSTDLEKRPVAKLVQEASKYESSIYLEYEDKKVNAKSIMGMMSLLVICAKNTKKDDMVNIIAEGADERAALHNMERYLSGEAS